jgi:hypothetical protein
MNEHRSVKDCFLSLTKFPEVLIDLILDHFCQCKSSEDKLRLDLNKGPIKIHGATVELSELKDHVTIKRAWKPSQVIPLANLCYTIDHDQSIRSNKREYSELQEMRPYISNHCNDCRKYSTRIYHHYKKKGRKYNTYYGNHVWKDNIPHKPLFDGIVINIVHGSTDVFKIYRSVGYYIKNIIADFMKEVSYK